ncbi:alpha/beta fold hydrolase [Streptomyces sp. NPDC058382]|uniref:alpha/beta fold hydrolase n=1 Tax=unclassified Streptomyces TaxID=2593676 RepID=UPI00362F3805
MPPSHTRHTLKVSGAELDVRVTGDGPPVLLLHGAPGPDSVQPVADHLAGRHRVIAPTHPGWDGTERPAGLDSVGGLAEICLALLDELGTGPVALVGTSFGGWIAAETVLRDRDRRIERLVLMDAIGPLVPGHPIAVPGGGPGGPIPPQAPGGAPSGPPPGVGPQPAAMAALRAYAGADMRDPGLLGRLRAVTCPVLVVWGENDRVASPDFGRAYAAAFGDARFELIAGAGHLPVREQPAATFAVLDGFLD